MGILVVDDDQAFRRLARRLLDSFGLEVVAEAGTVAEALEIAQAVRPAAALVDVQLPDGDGFDLAADLTAMPWRPRVVMASAQFGSGFDAQAARAGAQAFILKTDLPRASLTRLLSGD